jgi:hypothetical protein
MRTSLAAVALCVCAVTLTGCHRRNMARRNLATNQGRAVAVTQPPSSEAGQISRVSLALHTGPEGKAPSDTVVARVARGNEVLGAVSVGAGEAWLPGSMRALEVPLDTPVDARAARDLRIEVSKSDPSGQPGAAWTVQAEALGQMTDGRVVRLLEMSPPATVGGSGAFRQSWPASPQ